MLTEHVTRYLAHSKNPKQCELSLISPSIGYTEGLTKRTPQGCQRQYLLPKMACVILTLQTRLLQNYLVFA